MSEAFLQVLLMARELKLLKVGTVSIDGTQLRANASRYKSLRLDRAEELREQLQGEIDGLLVEPVFGIVKEAMGFRWFLLRGLAQVEAEWALVTLAYNCKRLNNMRLT